MSERVKITAKTEAQRNNPVKKEQHTGISYSINSPFDSIMSLHRTVGNRAVQRLFESGAIQTKLQISQPGDVYEQEADRVAEQVMRMPEPALSSSRANSAILPSTFRSFSNVKPTLQRQPMNDDQDELLQTKEAGSSPQLTTGADVSSHIAGLKGGGQPLSQGERTFFEPRFGYDFSGVRLHTDSRAADLAHGVNARAFVVGRDVVFGAGEYRPGSFEGRRLVAHELGHVVQQKMDNHILMLQQIPVSAKKNVKQCTFNKTFESVKDDIWVKLEQAKRNPALITELYILLKRTRACFSNFNETEFLNITPEKKIYSDEMRRKIARFYNKEMKKDDRRMIWAESKKPFAGYFVAGIDSSGKFLKEKAKFGFDYIPSWRRADEIIKESSLRTERAFQEADILIFTGHHYSQYKAPGVWGVEANGQLIAWDLRYFIGPINRVKLIISTSCATLCREAANVWKPLFPNAVVLGYKKSPSRFTELPKFLANKLSDEYILDSAGILKVVSAWKSAVVSFHPRTNKIQPGWLKVNTGIGEYWDGRRWINFNANDRESECSFKGDYSSDYPDPRLIH